MSSQELLPHLAQKARALGKKLEEPVRRVDRSPVGLDNALESTCRQEARNIWLDAGFQAWYAWHSVDDYTRAALAELPESDLRDIALFVCSIRPHDTVQCLFEHLFHSSFRGNTRRRWLISHHYSCPESKGISTPAPAAPVVPSRTASRGNITPAHRQPPPVNNSSHDDYNGDENFNSDNDLHDHPVQPEPMTSYNESPDNAGAPEVNDVERSFPEPKYLPAIFPYQTCVSIVKTARGASVRTIPIAMTSQSSLELDIYSAKVPYIARELFGLIIQIEHGRLYMRLDSGANASFDTLRLAGADHEAAKRILGQLYSAVHNDAHFRHEYEMGEVLTSFITLELKGDVKENSCLCIRGNASSISRIAGQLWPVSSATWG